MKFLKVLKVFIVQNRIQNATSRQELNIYFVVLQAEICNKGGKNVYPNTNLKNSKTGLANQGSCSIKRLDWWLNREARTGKIPNSESRRRCECVCQFPVYNMFVYFASITHNLVYLLYRFCLSSVSLLSIYVGPTIHKY